MNDDTRRDVIEKAYAILDETADIEVHEPCDPDDDVMIRHQALRERSRDYEALRERGQPPPRQIDTGKLPSAELASSLSANGGISGEFARNTGQPRMSDEASKPWNDWAIDIADRCLQGAMQRGGWLCNVIGEALGHERALHRRELKAEVAALRREIAELRNQIKARAADTPVAVAWHLDPPPYRLHLLINGKAQPPMNLRPLFERYHDETS